MMLHAASPTPPDLPLPLRSTRGAEDHAAARLAVAATPPFTLPAPLPAFSGLEAAPDDETTLVEPEDAAWADLGAAAAAPEMAAVDAAPMLQAPAIPTRPSDLAVASAGPDPAPAPLLEVAEGEPRPTIASVVPTPIDAEPEPGPPTSRTSGGESAEPFADGEAYKPFPAEPAINPGSGPVALPQAPQPADISPAPPVAPPQSPNSALPKLPVLSGEPAALLAALRGPGERAAVPPNPVVSADPEPAPRAAAANEPEASVAAAAARPASVAPSSPTFATMPAPIATGRNMPTDIHAVSGEWPIEPSAASPGFPRAVAEQPSRMVERTGSMPAVAGDEAIRGAIPTLETAEREFTRVAQDPANKPSLAVTPFASPAPMTVVQSANPQDAVEATPATVPPGATAPQPQPLSSVRPHDRVLPSRAADISAVPLSQTGPVGSEATPPRDSAEKAKAPLTPQLKEAAEVAAPPGAAPEAGVSTGPALVTLPMPRPPAEALQQPSPTVPLDLGSDTQWTERLSLDVRALIDGPVRQLRFKLRPVTLGEMAISVETERDQLRVALVVESREAHAIVTRDLDQLRAAIQQQGLRLDHATVELAASANPPQADAQTGGMSGWASQHRQPLPTPGEDGPASASSSEAKPQAPTRPVRTATGGRIDVYA